MSTEDNLKFSKHIAVRTTGYKKYENYDAIEIPFTDAIPSDHVGIMGVPISFLDKFNPDQFEIVWQASGNTRASAPKDVLTVLQYQPHREDRGGCGIIDGQRVYVRALIRNKNPQK